MGTCLDEIKFVFNVFFVLVEKSADMVFLHVLWRILSAKVGRIL
jgi:hypothetical protein